MRKRCCIKYNFRKYKTLHLYVILQIFPTLCGFRGDVAHVNAVESGFTHPTDTKHTLTNKIKKDTKEKNTSLRLLTVNAS